MVESSVVLVRVGCPCAGLGCRPAARLATVEDREVGETQGVEGSPRPGLSRYSPLFGRHFASCVPQRPAQATGWTAGVPVPHRLLTNAVGPPLCRTDNAPMTHPMSSSNAVFQCRQARARTQMQTRGRAAARHPRQHPKRPRGTVAESSRAHACMPCRVRGCIYCPQKRTHTHKHPHTRSPATRRRRRLQCSTRSLYAIT